MTLSRKQVEKQYGVFLSHDSCFETGCSYWICTNAPISSNEYNEDSYIDGWTLREIIEKLEQRKVSK